MRVTTWTGFQEEVVMVPVETVSELVTEAAPMSRERGRTTGDRVAKDKAPVVNVIVETV